MIGHVHRRVGRAYTQPIARATLVGPRRSGRHGRRGLRWNARPPTRVRYSTFASCERIASIGAFAQANIGVSRCVYRLASV